MEWSWCELKGLQWGSFYRARARSRVWGNGRQREAFPAHGGDASTVASAQQCQGDVRDTVVHGGEVQRVGASFAASIRAVEHLEGNGDGGVWGLGGSSRVRQGRR